MCVYDQKKGQCTAQDWLIKESFFFTCKQKPTLYIKQAFFIHFFIFLLFREIIMDISKLLVSNTEVITNKSHNSNEKANRTASNAVVNNKKRHACTWLGCRKSFSMYHVCECALR